MVNPDNDRLGLIRQRISKLDTKIKENKKQDPLALTLLKIQYQSLISLYGKLYTQFSLKNIESRNAAKIIEQPYVPISPVWPNKKLIILLSIILGLICSLTLEYILSNKKKK